MNCGRAGVLFVCVVLGFIIPSASASNMLPDPSTEPLEDLIGNLTRPLSEGAAPGSRDVIGAVPEPEFKIPSTTGQTYTEAGIAALIGILASLWMGRISYKDPEKILRNEGRKRIFHLVQEKPGIYLKQICQETENYPSASLWHLRKLERAGLIKSQKVHGRRIYYPLVCRVGMNA